ncbi:hypothetical protein VTN77DRAFT_9505 [Rasamsonia byssochlamydoides]|uniref:uncharacterized protein n=1 Tax=Rasamsonia byssochlamydoides TaxID=89139 RepID=UPI003742C834
MSQKQTSPIGFKFFSGSTLAAVLNRPTKKTSRGPETENNESEAARAAHARRREQVRRAQRNHRERKENYIKSLECQLLQLRDEATLRQEFEEASLENKILKDIMLAYNVPIPGPSHQTGGMAEVSMVGSPGSQRHLRVRMASYSSLSPGFITQQQDIASRQGSEELASHLVPVSVSSQGTSSATLSPQSPENRSHPYSLDSTQTGIDFVLSLEQPCLEHTYHPILAGEAHGHALTVQAALLTYAPNLDAERSWDIPAVELDRLLQLSLALDLNGELTPVQAWNLIKTHHGFAKLTPDGLQALRAAVAEKVECYGFGAVIDEHDLACLIDRYLDNPSP